MTGCCAPNCSNHSRNGYKLYPFPADKERRQRWIINCRRDKWLPTRGSRLCQKHFEESEFEQARADGWKKLKRTAIPTLFDVPNPPPTLATKRPPPKSRFENNSKKKKRNEEEQTSANIEQNVLEEETHMDEACSSEDAEVLQLKVKQLTNLNATLRKKLKRKENHFQVMVNNLQFLSREQIQMLKLPPTSRTEWSPRSISEGLKIRYITGHKGYDYLIKNGYPLPSYRTLCRRLQNINFNPGNLDLLISYLEIKLRAMSPFEKDCNILFDEMQIHEGINYDIAEKKMVGYSTLGSSEEMASHLLVGMVRGMNTKWKQVISWHLTGKSVSGKEMKCFLLDMLKKLFDIGLNVKAIVSDMGASNQALWRELGVKAKKDNLCNVIKYNEHLIYVFADVPHILKNVKSCLLSQDIYLPDDVVSNEELPTDRISHSHIIKLFENERKDEFRLAHHLKKQHIYTNHFQKMKVGLAVQYFSIDTAAALETGVRLAILEKEALTTAWFIRFINQWYNIMNSLHIKTSITKNNFASKCEHLDNAIRIISKIGIGKKVSAWKPLQTGIILSSSSLKSVAHNLLLQNNYKFVLSGRFNQNVVENLFSTVRAKAMMMPTALQVMRALKLVTISQFHNSFSKV